MKFSLLSILLFSMCCCELAFSQGTSRNDDISKTIQKSGLAFLKNKTINSASIGVYKDGEVYTQHFGELKKGKANPPDDETLYEIGSVTKTMTAYLVARAVLEEKIMLDDDISLYLKGDYSNLSYKGKSIQIKHLLTHTSGLPMFLPLEMNGVFEQLNDEVPSTFFELENSYNKNLFLEDLKEITLSVEPGIIYSYSNVGAELLGFILEAVYQKSIDELLKESFLAEYEMANTGIELKETQKQNLVHGYWMENETFSPLQVNKLWATGSGVKMTIIDMMRYAKLQLDPQNPVVSESHQVLFEEGKTFKIAYFWRVWNDKYGISFNHHGGTTGTQNWLFIFPKYDLAISIITNQSGPKTPKLLSKSVQKMLRQLANE